MFGESGVSLGEYLLCFIIEKTMETAKVTLKSNQSASYPIDKRPDTCPFCHKSVKPEICFGFYNEHENQIELTYLCPSDKCQRLFVAYYFKAGGTYYLLGTSYGLPQKKEFSESIKMMSSQFEVIYNQSYLAEQMSLFEICGVGYRKALEFLIKDYLSGKFSSEEENIKNKNLGRCIDDYVDFEKLKMVAKRAIWLGNDETHYLRKWETKDLNDLKKLIDLTIHWIEAEILTEEIALDMPE